MIRARRGQGERNFQIQSSDNLTETTLIPLSEFHPSARIQRVIEAFTNESGQPSVCPQAILDIASALDLNLQILPCCVGLVVCRIREYIIKASIQAQSEQSVHLLHDDLCRIIDGSVQSLSADVAISDEYIGGLQKCVHCANRAAIVLCTSCADYLCKKCFGLLHGKGRRLEHTGYWLDLCNICDSSTATIHSSVMKSSFCEECFANKFLPNAPPCDLGLRKVNSAQSWEFPVLKDTRRATEEWIPFYDEFGACYFFNFKTMESFRRKPLHTNRELPETEPVIPDESSDVTTRMKHYQTSL